jgi:hypothetical protein
MPFSMTLTLSIHSSIVITVEQRCCQTSSLRTHLPESDRSTIGAFLGDRQHVYGHGGGFTAGSTSFPDDDHHQVLLTRLGPLGPNVERNKAT